MKNTSRYIMLLVVLLSSCREERKVVKPQFKTSEYKIKKLSFVSDWKVDSSNIGTLYFPNDKNWKIENENYYLDTLELNLSKKHIASGDFKTNYQSVIKKLKSMYIKDSLIYSDIKFDSVKYIKEVNGVKKIIFTGEYKKGQYQIEDLIFLSKEGVEMVFSSILKKNKVYQDSIIKEIKNAYEIRH